MRIVIVATLSTQLVRQVAVMTTCSVTGDGKVCSKTLGFHKKIESILFMKNGALIILANFLYVNNNIT